MLAILGEAERLEGTVVSDAVNLASRLEGLTKVFGAAIVTSEETPARVEQPEHYHVRYVGGISVKGRDEPARVYEVFDGDPPDRFELKSETKQDIEAGVRLFDEARFSEAFESFGTVLEKDADDRAALYYREKGRSHCDAEGQVRLALGHLR